MTEPGSAAQFGPRTGPRLALENALFVKELMPAELLAAIPDVPGAASTDFVGITTDGVPHPEVLRGWGDEIDPRPAVAAARAFLASLGPELRARASQPVDAPQWRMWTNAFPFWAPHGVRLDECDRSLVFEVIGSCLSEYGLREVRDALRLNAALGLLLQDYLDTLTEGAYFFSVFGDPDDAAPWGWQLYGHHVDLHCLLAEGRMVLTPTFIGAEPTFSREGRYAGTSILAEQRTVGLDLRRSFTPAQARQAVLAPAMSGPSLPEELRHRTDGRHRTGAGRDNVVLPYEGLPAQAMGAGQRELLTQVVASYAQRWPRATREGFLAAFRSHLEDSHFAWVGGVGDQDAFYYKVHSPVVVIEYDCHAGVFLDNPEPAPFHVHTIVRTPNGGDYGKDLLRAHLERFHA
ncbi:MAG: DUF3500 domain-containing protein [Nocardioidaceae bacterium]